MKRILSSLVLLPLVSLPMSLCAQVLNVKSELDSATVGESPQVTQAQKAQKALDYQVDVAAFPDVKALLDQTRVADAILALESKQPQHENNPRFFNLLGVLYLQQKQFASAAAAFERVVLIQSDNAGAWLDLAIANAEAGEFTQANQYFDYIEASHRPSAQILRMIATYRARMQKQIDDHKPWRNQFEYFVGRDTNANSGLLVSHITVTFEGKSIDLLLDEQYKAHPDTFRQVSNRSHFQSRLLGQNFGFDLSLTNRSFTKEHVYSYTDASLGMTLGHNFDGFDAGIAGSVEHFIWGNRSLLNNSETSLFVEKNFGPCQLSYVLDYESRRYVSTANLNARSLWSNIAGSCQRHMGAYQWEAAVVARRANDKPVVFRAGGATSRQENILRLSLKTPSALRADLSFSFGRAADEEGYSALLENNARRVVQRRNYRFQLSYPLWKDWLAFAAYEDNRNDSNLVLFRQRGRNISAGVRLNY